MKLSDPYNISDLKPRTTILAVGFAIIFGLLMTRLWYLQIWKGEEYREFSDRNRFKIKRLSAPRGKILDRNGRLLADNRPRFDVNFTRGYSMDSDLELDVLRDIFHWTPEGLEEQKKAIKSSALYQSTPIARDVTWSQLAKIENRSLELSGVDIEVVAVRDYLYGDAFFHVIGYTGEVNEQDLKRLSKRYPERNYRIGDQIGVIGAESLLEGQLRGKDGKEFVVVDVRGRPVQQSGLNLLGKDTRIEPFAGKTVQLTLDLELQLEAIRAFGNQVGAAVALDPKTGEILAMVSRPAIDANIFTKEISAKQLAALRNRPNKPFLDRTLAEHYPPGSTFKLVMATAALETGVVKPTTIINCPGTFRIGRRVWHDHRRSGFGPLMIRDAVKRSSNVFFFNIGTMLGLDNMYHWSKRFGLGRRTHLGHEVFEDQGRLQHLRRFNFEQSGFIPDSQWVQQVGNTTVEAETVNAGIGQGAFLATIIQLARMVSVFGNGGKIFQPQLMKSMYSPSEKLLKNYHAILENTVKIRPETEKIILSAMKGVVNESGGTASRARLRNFTVGGKTGTSQVISLNKMEDSNLKDKHRFQDHALFVALAPLEDPQIAVAVIVEHGGYGGTTAAPIARAMIHNYLSRKLKKGSEVGKK